MSIQNADTVGGNTQSYRVPVYRQGQCFSMRDALICGGMLRVVRGFSISIASKQKELAISYFENGNI